MLSILKKEVNSFFSSSIGYLVIALFLILNGLFLWFFKSEFNIFDYGFADLTPFFTLAPWILIFLIPAITMRSFSEEKRLGTLELLLTKPISGWHIVLGKYFGAFVLILLALVPTLLYVYTVYSLGNPIGNLDVGSTLGSYFGLLFLIAAYTSIGVFTSTLSQNQIVAFIAAVFICFFMYFGFEGIASADVFGDFNGLIENLGMVLKDENITYAEGLSHNMTSSSSFAIPLKLDVYYPDNNSTNRPIYMFIHGGGFRGGTKTKPEIVEMANYYASRGWVFASIDYRTAEELGIIQGMTQEELLTYYRGIAPQEWVENALQGAQNSDEVQQATAMYLAQRDAKAALRWIVANASTYNINKDFITVGGASAGAITTIALGISNQEDFRDEITISDDPTLSTTNLNESYVVRSMVYFWGSNIKLDVFEAVYELNQYDRYDGSDPELFMRNMFIPFFCVF